MNPNDYLISIDLLPRLLGAIYIFVFGALLFQVTGLIGQNGILPLGEYLAAIKQRWGKKAYYYLPTLYWWKSSDATLISTLAAGTILSVVLAFGYLPGLILPLLFILHLSVIYAGQDFLSFGWETFMLEIVFNTIFLVWAPNPFSWISLNFLLFRFNFQAGVSKIISYDANWRNLTAVGFHYQSQPLPNTTAWYIHKLPMWFHKISTAMMFFIELIVPFGIFAPEEIRFVTCAFLVFLQVFIWATGNFSYLNHLSTVLCVILISDSMWEKLFGIMPSTTLSAPLLLQILTSAAGATLLFLQLISLWNYLFQPVSTFSKILSTVSPFHIANRYGIFAVMTTKRYEIVVEGSLDGHEWREYIFRYKPSELNYRPRRISPYQPRLDWQMWFLPFARYDSEWWFQRFIFRLLQGSPVVIKLLRHNPFPDQPPKLVRALIYDYEFSDCAAKKREGVWWKRKLVGVYAPSMMLKQDE